MKVISSIGPLRVHAGAPRAGGAWTALSILVAIASPLQAAPRYTLGEPAAPVPTPSGQSVLYLTREQFVRALSLPAEQVFLDDAPLGYLPQRSYLASDVTPGRHRLWGVIGCPDLTLDVQPGRGYLLRLREVIDSNDLVSARWLSDDPGSIDDLVRSTGIARASPTPRGLQALAKKIRRKGGKHGSPATAARSGATGGTAKPGVTGGTAITGIPPLPLVFDATWHLESLDQVQSESDFSGNVGKLGFDGAALRYSSPRETIEIPCDSVTQVRYGGTISSDLNPWIEVGHRTPSGPRTDCFADSRSSLALETYNRLFAALYERCLGRHGQGALPESPAPGPDSTAAANPPH